MTKYEFKGRQFSGNECPKCNGKKWFPIPDSLASACEGCGFVRVYSGNSENEWVAGATLQEWARDIYESKNK